jgi:hypothetical protein
MRCNQKGGLLSKEEETIGGAPISQLRDVTAIARELDEMAKKGVSSIEPIQIFGCQHPFITFADIKESILTIKQ